LFLSSISFSAVIGVACCNLSTFWVEEERLCYLSAAVQPSAMKKQKFKDGGTPSRSRGAQRPSNSGGLEERHEARSRMMVSVALVEPSEHIGLNWIVLYF